MTPCIKITKFFSLLFIFIPRAFLMEFQLSKKNKIVSEFEESFSPFVFEFSLGKFKGKTFAFDTACMVSWVKSKGEGENVTNYLTIRNNNISGYIEQTNITSNSFSYLSAIKYENITAYDGVLGLGMSYQDYKLNRELDENDVLLGENEGFISGKYSYMESLSLPSSLRLISFTQSSDRTSGTLGIGSFNASDFSLSDAKTCLPSLPKSKNSPFFLHLWNCAVAAFSANGAKIPMADATLSEIFAVFSTAEEFVLAPGRSGGDVLEFFYAEIKEGFGEICSVVNNSLSTSNSLKQTYSNYKAMLCKLFDYNSLPDFKIELNGDIGLIATSDDLFKRINKTHIQFKILVSQNKDNSSSPDIWYLGDPFIKNYNFLLNFSSNTNASITLVPSSKFGLYLTVISTASGVLVLAVFIVIVCMISNEEEEDDKNREISEKIHEMTGVAEAETATNAEGSSGRSEGNNESESKGKLLGEGSSG